MKADPMLLGTLIVCLLVAAPAVRAQKVDQERLAADIKKRGGKVTVDDKSPDRPIVGVGLRGSKYSDTAVEHLRGLSSLRRLFLPGTRVSDAGLAHLKGMTNLEVLLLARTPVT